MSSSDSVDVLFVGPRPRRGRDHAGRSRLAVLAATLAQRGQRCLWLYPLRSGETPPAAPEGVTLVPVATSSPPFRAVDAHLIDVPVEHVFNAALRRGPPGVVHVEGYGGASTYVVTWLAERLGAPVLVVAEPIADVVCHRGTLVDWTGKDCPKWDDAARCARCCRSPNAPGMGPVRAVFAGALRGLGGLSPFPAAVDFENRLDRIVHGLACAGRVLVPDAGWVERLESLGVPRRRLRAGVPAPRDADAWLEHYAGAAAAVPTP